MVDPKRALDIPAGFLYLLRGFKLIFSSRRLLKYSILPFTVNTVLFTIFLLCFNAIAYYVSGQVFDNSSHQWYQVALSALLGVAMFIVSALVALFGFVAVGLVIAGPFNEMLSAEVEREITGKVKESGMTLARQIVFTMRAESKKMVVFLLAQAALLSLNLIPGVGQLLFIILNPLFIAFVMTYEFAGYALDRRGYGFTEKRKFIFSIFGHGMGFGSAVGLTLMIPLVHFMLLPVAVAGGTALALDRLDEGISDKP